MKVPPKVQRLIRAAVKAQAHAYCPLTRYAVGAAVLGESGRIYPGVNVESPTGILHVCAERAAIFSALSAGERLIKAVATVSRGSFPCGVCRQALLEFGAGDIPVYSVLQDPLSGPVRVEETRVSRLLPEAHTPKHIARRKKSAR